MDWISKVDAAYQGAYARDIKPGRTSMIMEWISTNDTLPKEGVDILVFRRGKPEISAFYDADWWNIEGVTHWMPLPEPPEGDSA